VIGILLGALYGLGAAATAAGVVRYQVRVEHERPSIIGPDYVTIAMMAVVAAIVWPGALGVLLLTMSARRYHAQLSAPPVRDLPPSKGPFR
jgi:hypothetical protein